MKQAFIKLTVLLSLPVFLLPGCASIVSHSSYPMYLHSTPANVNVKITDRNDKEVFSGQTPTTVTLKSGGGYFKKAEYHVKFSSPGYAEQNIPITYKVNGWYWGNLLLGGVIGMLIVDPATGAMYKPTDPAIDVDMKRSNGSASIIPSLKIIDINSLQASEKTELVRIK